MTSSFSFFSYLLVITSYVYYDLPSGTIYITCNNEFVNFDVSSCGTFECVSPIFSYFQYDNGTIVPILPVKSSSQTQYRVMQDLNLQQFNFIDGNNYFLYNGSETVPLTYFTTTSSFDYKTSNLSPCSVIPAHYTSTYYSWSFIYNNTKLISPGTSGYQSINTQLFQILI